MPIDQSGGATASVGNPVAVQPPSLTPTGNNELQLYFFGAQSVFASTITQIPTQRSNLKSSKEGFTLASGDFPGLPAGNPLPPLGGSASCATPSSCMPVITEQTVLVKPGP